MKHARLTDWLYIIVALAIASILIVYSIKLYIAVDRMAFSLATPYYINMVLLHYTTHQMQHPPSSHAPLYRLDMAMLYPHRAWMAHFHDALLGLLHTGSACTCMHIFPYVPSCVCERVHACVTFHNFCFRFTYIYI